MKTEVECVDWTWYLDRITVAGGTLTGTVTLKSVLQWLVSTYLAPYGFSLDAAQEDGPTQTVTGFTWTRKYASEVLRDLTVYSGGYVWSVSPAKVLRMRLPNLGTPTAPFAITDSNGTARDLQWIETTDATRRA